MNVAANVPFEMDDENCDCETFVKMFVTFVVPRVIVCPEYRIEPLGEVGLNGCAASDGLPLKVTVNEAETIEAIILLLVLENVILSLNWFAALPEK